VRRGRKNNTRTIITCPDRVRERLFLSVSIQRGGKRKKWALDRSREAAWASIGVSGTCRNVVVRRLEVSRSHGSGEMIGGGVGGRRAWREGGGGVLAATEQGGGWAGRRRQRSWWRDFQHRSTALRHRPTANAREKTPPGPFDRGCLRFDPLERKRLQAAPPASIVSAGTGSLAVGGVGGSGSRGSTLFNAGFGAGSPHNKPQRSRSPRVTGPPVPARGRPCSRA